MVRYIPDTIYGPVPHVSSRISGLPDSDAAEANPRCVHCSLEGTSGPLKVFYIVNGTSLCTEHARKAALK